MFGLGQLRLWVWKGACGNRFTYQCAAFLPFAAFLSNRAVILVMLFGEFVPTLIRRSG